MTDSATTVRLEAVTDAASLTRAWSVVLTHSIIRADGVWAMFIRESGVVLDPIEVLGEIPGEPDATLAGRYASISRDVLADLPRGTTVACAMVRPSSVRLAKRDRDWLDTLTTAAERWNVADWPLCAYIGQRLHTAS